LFIKKATARFEGERLMADNGQKRGITVKLLPLVTIFTCVAFQASARVYTTVDFPGANATEAFAINSNGDIVGAYRDSALREHGFLLHGGVFTTLDFPGAYNTEPTGINVKGDIVGTYFPSPSATPVHGFLWHNGTFTTIDAPGSTGTFARGTNDLGDIVGSSSGGGFLLHDGTFTNLDVPFPGRGGLASTYPWGINSQGDVVGSYIPAQDAVGFLLHAGVWSSISVGGAPRTVALGITSQGDVAGGISDTIGFNSHGFVISGGVVTTIDFPGAVSDSGDRGTQVNGINDHGDIVGRYDQNNHTHGFVALNQLTVSIMIKPGEVPASINTQSRGTIPVAILSAANFDATALVDRASLTFGHSGSEHSLSFCNAGGGDVNGDGLPDLMCHFTTQLTGFQPGDTMGVLNGKN